MVQADRLAHAGFGDGRLLPFADSLWTATAPIRFAGAWFSHVMAVVGLGEGQLLLHSPCRPTPALIEAIGKLGNVAHVVAPNWFHDLYIKDYRKLYPTATFWGPSMFRRLHGSRAVDRVLEQVTRPPWIEQMPHFTLSGLLSFDESIFFHRPSRTLIVADLLSNASAGSNAPAYTRLCYRILGLDGELMNCPIIPWFGFTSRRSIHQAAQQITEWKPQRIIVGHGTPVENDASSQLRAAFR